MSFPYLAQCLPRDLVALVDQLLLGEAQQVKKCLDHILRASEYYVLIPFLYDTTASVSLRMDKTVLAVTLYLPTR